MSVQTTTPGVYIEEDATVAISVSPGATAIPLFIADFVPLKKSDAVDVTRISSWLDFTQKFSAGQGSGASVELTSTQDKEDKNKYTYAVKSATLSTSATVIALQLYFQNGGGPCYIFPLAKATDDTLKDLPELIEAAGEITLIACPVNESDYKNAVYTALLTLLDTGNRGYFLLADSLDGKTVPGISSSAQVAAYYPLLNVTRPTPADADITVTGYTDKDSHAVTSLADLKQYNAELAAQVSATLLTALANNLISPSAVMAGVYCKTDRERGVWKAPANVVLNGISDVSVRVTDDAQGAMNLAGINVIRAFNDRGYVVWGARTLKDDDNWRYIPVRRLFDAAERDIKKAMRPMVFEPNSQPTWQRVQNAIDNYLYRLWQQGGLAGNKASEAYFVNIGKDITMTEDDIKQGKMIVQIGMAAVRPAEFIILQFTQNMSQ